ncbi:PepSY domain-containing protein [Comamonas sp. NLF-1-9]|uniref:PepSY domain-containing protein n=1 Tax=Comamonas sp. NLF-1-9 TaxID=2853163 RepID=UPI001C47D19C|nr:PepSY domain-containing protein [Comamonas sp. NLF-1-9]QXL84013.1 PepSY domain-containing protein [Comamonas sp. NLF-1-9]
MVWRQLHRWIGLVAGAVAVVLGITGAVLALEPVQSAWQSPAAARSLSVAQLADRVAAVVPGAEEIRRLPSGDTVVYAFDHGEPRASRIDPQSGQVLGAWEPSATLRWLRNLHRKLLLGDIGRLVAAGAALAMALLCITGLVLLQRRQGGWRKLGNRVRGSPMQRLHCAAGRALLAVLLVSSLAALNLSAASFGLVQLDGDTEPEVASRSASTGDLAPAELALLQQTAVRDLRKLNFPSADDPGDTWHISTAQGQGWIDRHDGQTLAWQPASTAQRINDWALLLHTGEGAWPWALVLGASGLSIALFWGTGLMLWWQARRLQPRLAGNRPLPEADTLIFVASENGSTWGFAQALHAALTQAGHPVHASTLEHFATGARTRQVFVLAATYGDGQAPAHAARALQRIAQAPVTSATVTVLGFGDRQFQGFCAFAGALESALRARGWPSLLPLARIHQQSAQEFALWGERLGKALGEPLALQYRPSIPRTTALTLVSRQDYPGAVGEPAAILRFAWPKASWAQRLGGRALGAFAAGDLLGVLPPDGAVPRLYSLASSAHDGFIEICVRRHAGGLCSGYLHALQPGERIAAFIRPNPGFTLQATRRPVMLIGAGTGVAPLAGFIRGNTQRAPMHLYYGTRDPALDYYFGAELQTWLQEQRLASLHTAFSRAESGGGHVQDALQRDATRLQSLIHQGGAIVRVCGSQAMARAVAQTLDAILAGMGLSVQQLKAQGRYAEDTF